MHPTRLHLPASYLFTGQLQHLLLLACLVPGAIYLAKPALEGQAWLGIGESAWFYALTGVVIAHQVLGWFVFRTQLIWSLFTRLFGQHDLLVWGILFTPLFLLRVVLSVGLAVADAGSLAGFREVQIGIGLLLLPPAIYTLWSVGKFFGVPRALGGDHFRQVYREMSMVREGAFKYSANAMYTFAFLIFWAIALLAGSRAALAAALFQHAYIWVHMAFTEEPDMQVIYGANNGLTS